MMKYEIVEGTVVKAIGYDEEAQLLRVEFRTAEYEVENISPKKYQEIMTGFQNASPQVTGYTLLTHSLQGLKMLRIA